MLGGVLVACTGMDTDRVAVGDYLSPYESQAARFALLAERYDRHQEAIATCMAEGGFEYVAHNWNLSGVTYLRDDHGDDEIAERLGYGITTVDPATHILDSANIGAWDDPALLANNEYRANLDVAAREAYDLAMYGPAYLDGDVITPPTGCISNEVYSEANGIDSDLWDVVTADLDPLLEDLEERIEADPRVVAARAGWVGCMAETGHPYADEDEIRMAIAEQLWALQEAVPEPDWDPTSGEPPPGPRGPFEVDPDGLEALRAEELEIAAFDWDCRQAHLGPVDDVRAELEGRFIEQHQELLEQRRSFDQ